MMILRHACADLLDGNLSWQGVNVPVSDEKRRLGETVNLYVTFGTQQEIPDDTSDAFITTSSIEIQIIDRTEFEVSKDALDSVSNQILDILIPTPNGGDGFQVQDHFQILNVRRASAITRNFSISDSKSVVGKIITITATIVQQFP